MARAEKSQFKNNKSIYVAVDSSHRYAIATLMSGAIALGMSPILVRLSELEPTATAFHRVFLALPLFQRFQSDHFPNDYPV